MQPVVRSLGLACLSFLAATLPAQNSERFIRPLNADAALIKNATKALGVTKAELIDVSRRDAALHLSRATGSAVYLCKPPRLTAGALSAPPRIAIPMVVGVDNTPYIGGEPFDLPTTFALHSRPGAKRIIYLDFDGHVTTGTDWNKFPGASDPIVSTPFDLDGDPTTFNDEERAAIHEVWRRVSEDYAPFDVDVTTQEPPAGDLVYGGGGAGDRWGIRMVCGGWAVDVLGAGNEGVIGVALLNSFNWTSDTPAYTFVEDILGFVPQGFAAEIAYTVSHEVGHTLGLRHDGCTNPVQEYYPGYAGWAPIMGSGNPNSTVQWSRGEYEFANNREDDLALINAKFIPYIPLDHAADKATAPLLASGDVAGGTLIKRTDTAWYLIESGTGTVNVTALVSDYDPNLKAKLTLYALDGTTVIATSDPNDPLMDASLSVNVDNGAYYLVVDGTSWLTPFDGFSDYDSIGRYFVGGTWPSKINAPPVALTDGSTGTTAYGPMTAYFVGTASFDPDGVIASYLWDFGDGTTSTLANPSHSFPLGTYTVTLTVTDNSGDTDSTTIPVSALNVPKGGKVIFAGGMTPSWVSASRTTVVAQCVVTVVDSSGRPMPGVDVTAGIDGLATGAVTVRTDKSGKATLRSAPIPLANKGTVSFTLRNAALAGYYYYQSKNKVSRVTLTR